MLAGPKAVKATAAKVAGSRPVQWGARSLSEWRKPPPSKAVNSLATLAKADASKPGAGPQLTAAQMQPVLVRQLERLGITPDDIVLKESHRGAPIEDLYYGMTPKVRGRLAKVLNKPVEQVRPAAIEMAESLVDDIHRPIKAVMEIYAKDPAGHLAGEIAAKLEAKAGTAITGNSIYRKLAKQIRNDKTIGGLNGHKTEFNQAAAPVYDKATPSAVAATDVAAANAYREAANLIREEVYGHLERIRKVEGLGQQGRLEAKAWDIRDGIYKSWGMAAGENAPAAMKSWLSRVGKHIVQGTYFPRGAAVNVGNELLTGALPLQEFNRMFKDAIRPSGITMPEGLMRSVKVPQGPAKEPYASAPSPFAKPAAELTGVQKMNFDYLKGLPQGQNAPTPSSGDWLQMRRGDYSYLKTPPVRPLHPGGTKPDLTPVSQPPEVGPFVYPRNPKVMKQFLESLRQRGKK